MMFSSNQVLQISGSIDHVDELYAALKFGLEYSGDLPLFTRKDDPVKCVWQITEDGKFCIGCDYEVYHCPNWESFSFDFDLDIIARIIIKHLEKYPIKDDIWDGSYEKGFLMSVIPTSFADEYKGIKHPSNGVLMFEPFTAFYAK